MDAGKIYGRGIKFPPEIGSDGRLSWSQGEDNIRESIKIILLTQPHERLMLPEFGVGLQRYLFRPNTAATHRLIEADITRGLIRWEPRIRLESVIVEPDPDKDHAAVVTISYRLVADGAHDQVRLTVKLAD